MAIADLCAELRNYFLPSYKDPAKYIHEGSFTVANGQIQNLPFLQNGQYYRIVGSVFNDGVWLYGTASEDMTDEEFSGAVWEMAIPKEFINLSNELDEIDAKVKAAEIADTGYTSESFGGYSYTKRSGISDELAYRRGKVETALRSKYRRLVVL